MPHIELHKAVVKQTGCMPLKALQADSPSYGASLEESAGGLEDLMTSMALGAVASRARDAARLNAALGGSFARSQGHLSAVIPQLGFPATFGLCLRQHT